MELTGSSMVAVTSQQVSTDLDGETVVLELSKGVYYGLPGVGATIWELIQRPRAVDELVREIRAEYEVDEAECRADLVLFLRDMIDRGLARTVDGSTS